MMMTPMMMTAMTASESELSATVQELWDNDINRLRPGKDYRISLQGKVSDNMAANDDDHDKDDDKDGAGSPLFKFVDENIFQKETFSAFISLLDNYVSDTGEPEIVTPEEVAENHKFLDAIVKTPPMKIAHRYLVAKNLSPRDETQFKEQLYTIWFELYARRGSSRPDSSGFEHVFVGETRGGRTVIGFHNWIQLYLQEKLGHVHYKGYSVHANSPQPAEWNHILSLQFSWKNGIKPKGSILVGVSPEFEFALYTLCFLGSPDERVKVRFSFYRVEIVCHRYNRKHIGTTYPVLLHYQQN
ncbi:uridylate-specific endoribonuclease B [Festucalex cinctus]